MVIHHFYRQQYSCNYICSSRSQTGEYSGLAASVRRMKQGMCSHTKLQNKTKGGDRAGGYCLDAYEYSAEMKGDIFSSKLGRLLKIYLVLLMKLEGFHIGPEFHPQGLLWTKRLEGLYFSCNMCVSKLRFLWKQQILINK